jgi:hypothetical protein
MREVEGPSLIFINLYIPAWTLRLDSKEISLQLSENITLFAAYCVYTDGTGKETWVAVSVCGVSFISALSNAPWRL